MFEKSNNQNNIFMNILKNIKKDSPNITSNKKITINNSDLNKPNNNNFDQIQFIEKLPTYEKVCTLQNLLKEIISIRRRFEKNKNIMLERIRANCKEFYKSQIGMKEIYDYCKSDNPEKYYNYVLVENNEERLGKENYNIINKVIFLLRDNNDLLFNLIMNCPNNSFEELSDFLVNFFFNNTIDSSFNEEELIMIIYLILEQKILNEENTFGEGEENYIFSDNNLIHYIIKYLTRKPDVRSFTYTILSNHIIQFEEYYDSISIDIKMLKYTFLPTMRKNYINRKSLEYNIKNINDDKNSFSLNDENAIQQDEISKKRTYKGNLNDMMKMNI